MEVTAGQAKVEVSVDPEETEALESQIKSLVLNDLQDVLSLNSFKAERDEGLDKLEEQILEKLSDQHSEQKIGEGFKNGLKGEVRSRILNLGIRPDGRSKEEIRPISCEVGTLPRTHGSGLFLSLIHICRCRRRG